MSKHQQIISWCEQSSTILNSLPSGVLVVNSRGRIQFTNKHFLQLLGFAEDELIGEKLWLFLNETEIQQISKDLNTKDKTQIESRLPVFEALAARDDNYNIIWNLKKKNGENIPATASMGHIYSQDDNDIIGFITIVNEATELNQQLIQQHQLEVQYKTALDELTQSQKRYQQIFAHAPLGIFHFDNNSIILDANQHMIDLLYTDRISLIGMNMLQTLKDKHVLESIRSCLSQGIGHYEGNYKTLNGTHRPLRGLFKAVRNTKGKIIGGVSVFEDVTEQYKTKQALVASESSYRQIFDNALHTIYIQSKDGVFLKVNLSAEKMYGYSAAEIVGKTPEFLAAPGKNDLAKVTQLTEKAWQGKPQRFEFWGKRKNGEIFPKDISVNLGKYLNQDVLIVFAEDITERKLAESQIHNLANQDSLTGLPNRRLLIERTEQLLKLARRHKMTLSLLYLDLDKFKDINDTQGHDSGDKLLVEVSHRLQQCLRDSDTLARLGGDEFAILLPDSTKQHALNIGQRIIEAIELPFKLAHTQVNISASMGISLYPQDGSNFHKLFRHADIAMYKAKNNNHKLMLFQPKHREEIEHRVTLEKQLAEAIDNDQLLLHYQPRLSLNNFNAVSVEALVRWQHPEKALIYPGVFIPIAESSGLIFKVGHWVINKAISQAKKWQTQGIELPVAVNISIQELQSSNLARKIEELLDIHQLPSYLLELEITETAAMTNVEQSLKTMTQLKNLGIKLSIDDFGTGYSSLNYLKKLPADFLKIDRSFIVDIDSKNSRESSHDKTIIETIVALGKSLKMPLIAEGVETKQQEIFLQSLNIEMAQGFRYCKPLAADKFIKWYENSADNPINKV